MPRAKQGSPSAPDSQGPPNLPGSGGLSVGDRCRLWWPPTDDEDKSDYAGAFWPVTIVDWAEETQRCSVQYDNEEVEEDVRVEHLQPESPPVAFGDEAVHLQVGEFVEVFNESKTDPAAWIGMVHAVRSEYYVVKYPFHDTPNERITKARLRRVRLFEKETGSFKILKPNQTWGDGEIESPVELETMTAKELAMYLQKHKTSSASKSRATPESQGQAVKKRKGNPQRAH